MIMDFLGLVAPEWFFSSLSFHFVDKIFVFFKFRIYNILLHIVHTHNKLEVILFFHNFLPILASSESFTSIFFFFLSLSSPLKCFLLQVFLHLRNSIFFSTRSITNNTPIRLPVTKSIRSNQTTRKKLKKSN